MLLLGTLGTCVNFLIEVVDGWSDEYIVLGMSGIDVTYYKACAALSSAFLVVSPPSRLIVVVKG